MAVIDAHEKMIGVVVAGDGLAQLRGIDLIARFGCRMDVASAHQTIDHLAIAEEQPAALARLGLPRVDHDLVPHLTR